MAHETLKVDSFWRYFYYSTCVVYNCYIIWINEPNVKTPVEGRSRNALGLNKVFICWKTILFCANYIYIYIYIYIYLFCFVLFFKFEAVFYAPG